jgi:hypothetical protein
MKELMNEVEKRFTQGLQAKTNWGRDEILQLYNKVTNEVYLEYLAKTMDRRN